jgi:glycosyltransferase involved in cell wall biosynthesis
MPHLALAATMHPPADVRVFTRWVCGLAARGWRVSLIAPRRGTTPPPMPAGAAYYEIPEAAGYLARLLKADRVLPFLRDLKPDVVLAVDPELLPVLLRYRGESRAAVVFDRHENFDEPGTLYRGGKLGKLIARAYVGFERYAAPRLDGVVVVIEEMVANLHPRTRAITAHNFPTRSVLAELAGEPAPGTPRYTAINLGGQLSSRGYPHLLELTRVLVRERGRQDFTFALGGRFEPGGYEKSEEFRRQHGLEANLTLFSDFLPHAEAVNLTRAAQIGLTPYLNNAKAKITLQNKVLEFMGAGLPVITSPSSLNGKFVADAGCGALHWADEVGAIADTIEAWMDAPDEARRLGARGQEYALAKLVWEAELDRIAPWLEERIARRRGERG